MTGEEALIRAVERLLRGKARVLVGLDGMSASGKTTLAEKLRARFSANVYHMDDFFLPAAARGDDWQSVPAGNMDLERFSREVLGPLKAGRPVCYRPYLCARGALGAERAVAPSALEIVEGAYATHPALGKPYDLSAFVEIGRQAQLSRILARNGAQGLARFESVWIPMEHRYFEAFRVRDACDLVLGYEAEAPKM